MLKQTLINFSSYLVYFLPLAILTGPFLPDLFISVISLIFLFLLIRYKEFEYINNFYFKIFVVFCVYLIFCSLISDFPYFSLKSSMFYFRFGTFSIAIWYLLDNKKEFLEKFTFYFIVIFLFAIFSGFYQYFFSQTLFGLEAVNNRLFLLTSDGLLLGQYLSRLFPLLIALLIYKFNGSILHYLFLFLVFTVTDVLVYLSGERTALGLIFLSSLFIIFFISKLKVFRIITIVFSVIVLVIISIYNPEIKKRNIDYTINQLGVKQSQTLLAFSFSHESLFRTSLNMFKSNPIVGVGPNNFRNLCADEDYKYNDRSCSTHTHNNYLQIISETGIIGLFFILLPSLYLFRLLFRSLFKKYYDEKFQLSDFQICLVACFLCTLWPVLPTLNFFNNWINIVYFLPIGFFIHSLKSNPSLVKK